jgi:alkylhydroperoxidase family enzyme
MIRSRSPEEAAERQRQIQADGPRIEPYSPSEMPDMALEMHGRVSDVANREDRIRTKEDIPEFFGTLMRHPVLFEKQTEFGLELLARGAIPPRERELAILRIAWHCGAPYEFGEHVYFAHRLGITSEEIDAVKAGPEAANWTEHERLVLTAVDELFGNAVISDATWAGLGKSYNEQQLIELPIVIGQYHSMAYLLNSLRARLHEGNAGLMAR